jgi:hypothetical protein
MNIVHEAILRACWQEENEAGFQPARPRLHWFLARVLGMKPVRESSTKQRRRQQWLAIRKEAATKIDPETAEVSWEYGSVRDPYYLFEHGDDWEDNIGRNYFVRAPGSDMWVWDGDLPEKVHAALWERLARLPSRDETPF